MNLILFKCLDCGHEETHSKGRDGELCDRCNGHTRPIGTSKNKIPNNKRLTTDINIKNMKQFKTLLNVFVEIILDEQIDKKIREYYLKALIENIE